jgi:deazaflavin-dependent oxidoreductase (nitroreductase family)
MVAEALFKVFMRVQIVVFRLTNGKAMSFMRGMPVLLLTTVGRKTGKPRTTPLMYIQDGDHYVITASNNGKDKDPFWFRNLKASPEVRIEVPGKRMEVTASVATQTEYEQLWARLVSVAPFFDNYRKGTSRPIPMVILRPR